MSQWGAFGQAKAGRDYRAILGTTTAAPRSGPPAHGRRARARARRRRPRERHRRRTPLAVFDVDGKRYVLPVGPVTVGPKLELPVGKEGKQVGPARRRSPSARPPGAFLTVAEKAYRGDLRGREGRGAAPARQRRRARGVPPRRRPGRDAEGLAARGAQGPGGGRADVRGRPPRGGQGLRPLLRLAQPGVLRRRLGGAGADPRGRETRGEIVTYEGAAAQTFYFSSSGGRTISSLDVFGTDVPYLVSVDDPWDAGSPNFRWPSQLLTGAQLAKRFGLAGAVTDAAYVPGAPGRPAVHPPRDDGRIDGRPAERRPRPARAQVHGLPARRAAARRPGRAGRAGASSGLTGLARPIDDVVLERRGTSGAWATVEAHRPAADGSSPSRSGSTRRPSSG